MDTAFALLLVTVILGLAFEFVNGFHDAANAIATVIATRVLPPRSAVIMAAALNVLGALSGTAVATTVGKGLVDPSVVDNVTVIAALVSAIVWDLITWRMGLPSSSSHALVFSVMGAGVATAGPAALVWTGISKTGIGVLYSPTLALLSGLFLMSLIYLIFHNVRPGVVNQIFNKAQVASAAYMAFSHGGNDGQKTMGIIALALFSYGALGEEFYIPTWVILTAALSIGLGTAAGGYRIIRTMGFNLVDLRPVNGFAAEMAGGTVIEVATRLGVPISTTHAITGAIMGVGSARRIKSVRWMVAQRIIYGWILTIPVCFMMGFVLKLVFHYLLGLP